MTDADLRELERAARAAPDDARAASAFAAALDRAGRRRDAFLERCRAAHAGDDLAVAEVERCAAEVAGGDLVATCDLAASPTTERRAGAIDPEAEEEGAEGAGLHDELDAFAVGGGLVLRRRSRLVALRDDLSTAWEVADSGRWAVVSDDGIVHAPELGRLALRSASEGVVVAEAAVTLGPAAGVAAWGDRLAVGTGRRTASGAYVVQGLDLGRAFGRAAWTRELERDDVVAGNGRLAFRTRAGPAEVASMADGRTLARIGRLASAPRASLVHPLAVAPDGVTVLEGDEALTSGADRGWLGPESVWIAVWVGTDGRLERRWRYELPGARTMALVVDASRVVARVRNLRTEERRLVALDRATGAPIWTTPWADTSAPAPGAFHLRGATVLEVAQPPGARLRVLDAATGEVRAEVVAPDAHAQVVPTATGVAWVGFDGDVTHVTWPRRT